MKNRVISIIMIVALMLAAGCAPSAPAPVSPAEPAYPEEPAAPAAPEMPSEPQDGYPQKPAGSNNGSGESYSRIDENTVEDTLEDSVVTFSLKVDTAAYSNIERYINDHQLPPTNAVRTEEMINYFNYDMPLDFGRDPFSIYTEVGPSAMDESKCIAFIRVKARDIDKRRLPNSNLTFLIDTSGSMASYDKLPLLQEAFALLVETLDEDDVVSIVTYAGSSAIILDSCSGADKQRILNAIFNLQAGGSTAGARGIETAYQLADKNFMNGGNNRIILATDGDFNVGINNVNSLNKFISQKRDTGVYLSVLGFGTGNIRDDIMENLSKNGNGNYSYINSIATAEKVLVDELSSNMFAIADDVKAQVEFNPENVISYRLIGYENRQLKDRDFDDDTKDAGEIGIGTDVVMLFELELNSEPASTTLKYGKGNKQGGDKYSNELFEVRIRYKNPGESESNLMSVPVEFGDYTDVNSTDFGFASSVAAFGELLRNSRHSASIDEILDMAFRNVGEDAKGYRNGFVRLLRQYRSIR